MRDTEWNLAACSIDLDSKDTSKLEQFKSVSFLQITNSNTNAFFNSALEARLL